VLLSGGQGSDKSLDPVPFFERSAMSNPYAPPRAAVQDISVASEDLDLADRGTRLGAAILDNFVFGVMVYLPFMVATIGSAVSMQPNPEDLTPLYGGILVGLIGLAAWITMTFRFLARNGQSIGKKMVGIKTVRGDGSPVSLARFALLRNGVNLLLSIIPVYGIIDSLFIFSESRQCLHDKMADTIVVKA
jgi:uncharacterized RDD family membrane protein YckC